jgi:hypothetical protein
MLARAIYLENSIGDFLGSPEQSKNTKWDQLKLTPEEWQMAKILVTILYPFYSASINLQSTSRPRIDQVFYTYDLLFNKIDALKDLLDKDGDGDWSNEPWANNLLVALEAMNRKLSKYYQKTSVPFVYSDAMILDPTVKLELFDRWSQVEVTRNYSDEYSDGCRARFTEFYESSSDVPAPNATAPSLKRKRDELDDDDYESMRRNLAKKKLRNINEYDRYLTGALSESQTNQSGLAWWKDNQIVHSSRKREMRLIDSNCGAWLGWCVMSGLYLQQGRVSNESLV